MGEQEFVLICKKLIQDYYEKKLDIKVNINQIYIVWNCKILQNNKTMISTDIEDGRYFEVIYNGDKDVYYLDSYVKEYNTEIRFV